MKGRIDRIEITEFEYRLKSQSDEARPQQRFAVRIRTAEGVEGSYVPVWSAPPYSLPQVRALAERLIGRDICERELVWDLANNAHSKLDRIGASSLDIALWDALGKRLDCAIVDLLGRYRSRLPAYASSTSGRNPTDDEFGSPRSYAVFARWCLDNNFRAFKIHGPSGGTVDDEIAVLTAVAAEVGGTMEIMTDPGKRLPTLAQALKLGRVCDEVGAYWWEDPMRDNSPFGHRVLRDRVRTPLLLTEMVRGLEMRAQVALDGGTDFLRADPELDMGITGVMKTAHFAEAVGLDVEVHASGPAQRHCMAAIRNTNYYELGLLHPVYGNAMLPPIYGPGYVDDATAVGADGCVDVPDGPGLGVEYDWDLIDGSATDRHIFGAAS
jgi:L-alanine-DL-glutamate epimerase-like enolase superfamily enzyme